MTEREKQALAALSLEYPDALLLFVEGDFYVAHTEHAKIVASVIQMDVALDMEGDAYVRFYYESCDVYIKRLRGAGYTVVICETLPKVNKRIIIKLKS